VRSRATLLRSVAHYEPLSWAIYHRQSSIVHSLGPRDEPRRQSPSTALSPAWKRCSGS